MYRYYVSFTYQAPEGVGIGSLDVTAEQRISSVDDLIAVIPQITAQGHYPHVRVLAFSLYTCGNPGPRRGRNANRH